MLSEIMLQQTQTERVRKFYSLFLGRFPNVSALARAPLSSVLRAWQGLGYNRRAKFLRAAARVIMEKHGGKVPASEAQLVALPGIGRNTAGAILAFAFDKPVVFIETNIRRAFIHHFFSKRKAVSDKDILKLIERTLDRCHPRDWYYALMDYGAALGRDKTLANPNRRSQAYQRQGTFEGSDRKVRGEVIRALLREKRMSPAALRASLQAPAAQYRSVVKALQKEGILRTSRGKFTLGD